MSKWIPVLAVDDDECIRKALKRNLKLYGFKVYLAKDGLTGLKLAQEKRPKFILLDWMIPNRGMIVDLDQAFEIGANDYITKPSDLTQLSKIVKTKWEKYTEPADVR
jgi:DNA-binding response OmpR family regulator